MTDSLPDDGPEQNSREQLEEMAASMVLLSDDQRQRYVDLSMSPFERRTPEQQESIERLMFLAAGLRDEIIESFIEARDVDPHERTDKQQQIITYIHLQNILGTNEIAHALTVPAARELFTKWANTITVSPVYQKQHLLKESDDMAILSIRVQEQLRNLFGYKFGS